MFSVEFGYPCHLFLGDWLFHSGRRLLPLINVTRYTLVALWSWPWTDCSDGSKDIYCSVWWVKQPVLWLMWQIIHVTSDTCGALCLWPWDQVGFHDLNRAAAVSFPHVVLHQTQVSEWVSEWVSAAGGLSGGKTTGRVPESMTWSLLPSWSSIIFSSKQTVEIGNIYAVYTMIIIYMLYDNHI